MRLVLSAVLTGALVGLTACATKSGSPVDLGSVRAATLAATASGVNQLDVTEIVALAEPLPTRPTDATATVEAPPVGTAILSQLEPTATATPSPTVPAAARPTVTPVPTSSVVTGWLAYKNDFLGYEFAYPPEGRIGIQGVTGFPTAELPAGMTSEAYLQQLEESYPADLCVTVRYQAGFVTFAPAAEKEGRYTVPCGVTGVGDYDITNLTETVLIDGVPHSASGFVLRGSAGAWQGEFYLLDAGDSVRIHFGSFDGTEEEYLNIEETLQRIVASYRQNR